MANQYGPRIVTDGLACVLDAADRNSYVNGSTIWTDLSGNNNINYFRSGSTNSAVNGPTFNTLGYFTFDGINDNVNLNGGSVINNWNPDGISAGSSYRSYTSANIWFRASTINTGGVNKMIFSDNFLEYGFYQNNSTFVLSAVASKSTTIVANRWYNACLVADIGRPTTGTYSQSGTTTITCTTTYPLTFNTGNTVFISFTKTAGPDAVPLSQNYVVTVTGTNTFTVTSGASATSSGGIIYSHNSNTSTITAYINGSQLGSPATSNTGNGANDAPFNIGRDNGSATSYFAGDIAIFQLYNRNLTSSEINQNFNALRGRFGI